MSTPNAPAANDGPRWWTVPPAWASLAGTQKAVWVQLRAVDLRFSAAEHERPAMLPLRMAWWMPAPVNGFTSPAASPATSRPLR